METQNEVVVLHYMSRFFNICSLESRMHLINWIIRKFKEHQNSLETATQISQRALKTLFMAVSVTDDPFKVARQSATA